MRSFLLSMVMVAALACPWTLVLAEDSPAPDEPADITALMDLLGHQASEMAEFAVDFQCRLDMLLNQYNDPQGAAGMLGLMLASDNALVAAHDSILALQALQADPDMAPEAREALMETLRNNDVRVQVAANTRNDLDLLPVPEEYLFLRDRLKAALPRLAGTFEQLRAALDW